MKKLSTLNLLKLTLPLMAATELFAATSNNYTDTRLIIKFKPTITQQKLIDSARNKREHLLDKEKVEAELMQKLSADKIQLFSKLTGVEIVDAAPYALGGRVITFKHALTEAQLSVIIAKLQKIPGVALVQKDELVNLDSVVNLNEYNWHLYDKSKYTGGQSLVYKPGVTEFYGDDFFDGNSFVEYKGAGVTVAVLDTGYVPHPNFVSHLQAGENGKYGYTFIANCSERGVCPNPPAVTWLDPSPDGLDTGNFLNDDDIKYYFKSKTKTENSSWHGTNVIGAIIGQGSGVDANTGGAPDAKVVPVRMSGKGVGARAGYFSDIIAAMLWAGGIHPTIKNPHPAKVINMSFSDKANNYDQRDSNGCPVEYLEAFNQLNDAGITAVVTAGNDNGQNYWLKAPAVCKDSTKNVITVAALNPLGQLASYSNAGDVTIAASGGDFQINNTDGFGIWTTTYAAKQEYSSCSGAACFGYGWKNGTSLAAPLVTAAVADMLSANPKLTPEEIISILKSTAKPIAADKRIAFVDKLKSKGTLPESVGRLDVIKAVHAALVYPSVK